MSHVSARWVPRLLKTEEMSREIFCSIDFLKRYKKDKNFLDRIIRMDETWLHYYEPKGKRQSSVWKSTGTPPPKKAKSLKSMGKVMFMVFMDWRGILLSYEVPHGETNSAYYSKVLGRDHMHVIRKKRPVMTDEIENVIYHHDNAPAHTTSNSDLELSLPGFQRLTHPPYSPDLAPLDFAYFPTLKSHLQGSRFNPVADIRGEVAGFNNSLGPCWFQSVFDKWVCRHMKCVEHGGCYFEKE